MLLARLFAVVAAAAAAAHAAPGGGCGGRTQAEVDAGWLGPQSGAHPPLPKPGVTPYVPPAYASLYDRTWLNVTNMYHGSCFGCWFAPRMMSMVPFHSVLDAGAGNGELVRMLLDHGKDAYGFELSATSLEEHAKDLLAAGRVVPASVGDIPFADNSFDMVTSSDMLEHIPPEMARDAVRELVRVSRRHIVMSISLKSFRNKVMHSNLHARAYWERLFREAGAVRDDVVVRAMQERDPRLASRELLRNCTTETPSAAHHPESVPYEVCTAEVPWLLWGRKLREWRCVTTDNWELEPWMFAFRKLRGDECGVDGDDTACSASAAAAASFQLDVEVVFMLLVGLAAVAVRLARARRAAAASGPAGDGSGGAGADADSSFAAFQRKYLAVYVLMMGADWLQGPYVYALYAHYGFGGAEIARLFVAGFAASLVFGMAAGPLADKFGRRRSCVAYGVMYAVSCAMKHSSAYGVLMAARLIGGACTSILFSSFEAWMVHEHNARGFSDEQLASTFGRSAFANGVTAIGAAVLAAVAHDALGPVGPFDVALVALALGTLVILAAWGENYGDTGSDLAETARDAWRAIVADPLVLRAGASQALFEGAMYIFVFMWTPTLEAAASPPAGGALRHGWVFACFMVCVLIGSSLFDYLFAAQRNVAATLAKFIAAAAVALAVPAFSNDFGTVLVAFFVFEACVGVFWPSMGYLRGQLVPSAVRATVANIFRVPLNAIVILVLLNIDSMEPASVFLAAVAALGAAYACVPGAAAAAATTKC